MSVSRPLPLTALIVVTLEALVLVALWLLGHYFSA